MHSTICAGFSTGMMLLPTGAAMAASLVVYLPLDGSLDAGASTAVDGTAIGTNAATPTFVTGKFGQAAGFANTNGNTTTPNDWAVSLGNQDALYASDFSVSFWTRWTGTANASVDKAILGNSNWASGENTGWLVSSLGASREGKLKTDTGARQNEAIAWKDGNWNLVTLVVDHTDNLGFWYLNGALLNAAGDGFGSGTFAAGLNTLIGGSGNGTYSANTTQIDDVAIFSGQLSAQEVSNLWNGGEGRTADQFTVPEPGTAVLALLGSLGLLRRRR